MRAHIIENGIVTNTIEVESLDFMPGLVEATEGSIGWLYDGETFSPPPAPPTPVPQVVTIRQARLALLQAGLLDDIDAAIAASTDRALKIEWEFATEFRRDWPALLAMQPVLGLTDQQIDDLFTLAATL